MLAAVLARFRGKLKATVDSGRPTLGTIYFPIEVMAREFDAKILLAAGAVARGFRVVIGHKFLVEKLARKSPGEGIYFNKAVINPKGDKNFLYFQARGMKLVAQDEEAGLQHRTFAEFYEGRRSMRNISQMDKYFCWGETDFRYLRSQIGAAEAERVLAKTGSARSALWGGLGEIHYRESANAARRKFGEFILVATSLPSFNHILGQRSYLKFFGSGSDILGSSAEEAHLKRLRLIEIEREKFELFCDSIRQLILHTPYSVVIRPHPDEAPSTWRTAFGGSPRVSVESEGDISRLLFACSGFIHSSSTTALAAYGSVRHLVSIQTGSEAAKLPSLSAFVSDCTSQPDEVASLMLRPAFSYLSQEREDALTFRVTGRGSRQNIDSILDELTLLSTKGEVWKTVPFSLAAIAVIRRIVHWGAMLLPTRLLPRQIVLSSRKRAFKSASQAKEQINLSLNLLGTKTAPKIQSIGQSLFIIEPARPKKKGL